MKKLFLIVLFANLILCAHSKLNTKIENNSSSLLCAAAKDCGDALIYGDYDKMAELTFDKLLNANGGKNHFIELIKSGNIQELEKGNIMKSFKVINNSEIIYSKGYYQSLVNCELLISTRKGDLLVKTILLGISYHNSHSWKFMDVSNNDEYTIMALFPELSLKLPPKSKPILLYETIPK